MSLRRNIPLGYSFSFFSMFLVIIPVLIPYWQSLGLTLGEAVEIQAVFGLSVALFEVPTGYIADIFSRKVSVVVGAFITGLSFSFLPWATTYNELMLMEIALALGASLVSGADFAIVYDSIKDEADRLKVVGTLRWYSLLGETLAAIVSGVMVWHSFQAVLWAQVVASWIPFMIACYFIEPTIERMSSKNPFANMTKVLRHLFVSDSLTRLIFINGVVWGLSSFCVVWFLQPYWQASGVPLSWFGFIWAFLMLVSAVVSKFVHQLELKFGAKNLLLILSVSPCIAYFIMGSGASALGVAVGILFYINRGISGVLFQDALNWRVPSSFRATANSLGSLFFRLTFGLAGPLLSIYVDSFGLYALLILLGIIFTLLFAVVMYPLIKRVDELKIAYIPDV